MVVDLKPLTDMREPGFNWDGTSGLALPIDEQILLYWGLLQIILKYAPSGYPAEACLTAVFDKLQTKFGVFDASKAPQPKVSSDACGHMRGLLKALYSMKKQGECRPCLQKLVDMIILPTARSSSAGSEAVTCERDCLSLDKVRDMCALADDDADASSDDGLEIVHMVCKTQGCTCEYSVQKPKKTKKPHHKQKDAIVPKDVPAPPSAAAAALPPVPNAVQGKQRTETMKKSRKRLVKKTPAPPLVKKKKRGQKTNKKEQKKRQEPFEIKAPSRIVQRSEGRAYIMAPKFVCSASMHNSPDYLIALKEMCEHIDSGRLSSKAECKEKLQSILSK